MFYLWVFYYSTATTYPSEIIDFSPVTFTAKADSTFFYSIDNELKYSNQIDSASPTLFQGEISDFLVSPDDNKIAIVSNGLLLIVYGSRPAVQEVVPVGSIYKKPKPMGQRFFRDSNYQWSKDSKYLYLIKDTYYESKGSQLFSREGELWKFEIETGDLKLAIKPFPAFEYFQGQYPGVYFSTPTSDGDLQLRYFDGINAHDIDEPNARDISIEDLLLDKPESVFFSFSIHDYERAVLPTLETRLVTESNGPQDLVIRGRTYLSMSPGMGFKGPYYGSEMLRSVFLPGEKYFLFNVNCGNYRGQLLIDTDTEKYMTLPKETRVYLTKNTDTFRNYRITGAGIEPRA